MNKQQIMRDITKAWKTAQTGRDFEDLLALERIVLRMNSLDQKKFWKSN